MYTLKKIAAVLLGACLAGVALAGCGSSPAAEKKEVASIENKVLTVYTARSESLNNLVIQNFEKDTGIKVELIVAGTGALQKRVASEKDNPLGDVFKRFVYEVYF